MGNVGDDGHRTEIIIYYCRSVEEPVERMEDVDAEVQLAVKVLYFLVAAPRSAVIDVERLKFLYKVL